MASDTLKRLEEIEAVYHEDAHLVEWLCACLRDALRDVDDLKLCLRAYAKRPESLPGLLEAQQRVRRLFGEESNRGE